MEAIEFFNNPDGSIMYRTPGNAVKEFTMDDTDVVDSVIGIIRYVYVDAYKALAELYSKSELNKTVFEYKMVHQFIRCNFGANDLLRYDIENGIFNVEEVPCPMRGECKLEKIICKPRKKSELSKREDEVARLYAKGYSLQEIADELGITYSTVNVQLRLIRIRLNLRDCKQIIKLFRE